MVDALESCLDLDQGAKGFHMCKGWEEYKGTGKISREILQANFCVLHTLLDVNPLGIFKRASFLESLKSLDVKLCHKLSTNASSSWADDNAFLIHANIMELRRSHRNTKNYSRTPAWLRSLYDKLHSTNVDDGDSQEQQEGSNTQGNNIQNPLNNPFKRAMP